MVVNFTNRNFITNISKNDMLVRQGHPKYTGTIVQSFREKYFSINYHHSQTKYFSPFQNSPPVVVDILQLPNAFAISFQICFA